MIPEAEIIFGFRINMLLFFVSHVSLHLMGLKQYIKLI